MNDHKTIVTSNCQKFFQSRKLIAANASVLGAPAMEPNKLRKNKLSRTQREL